MSGKVKPVDNTLIHAFDAYVYAIKVKLQTEDSYPNEESITDIAIGYTKNMRQGIDLSLAADMFDWDIIIAILRNKQCVD